MLQYLRNHRTHLQLGFTAIEMLVTMAILGILVAIAVPNLTSFVVNADLRGAVSTLQTDAMNARSEAIKLARPVIVRPTFPSIGWIGGWQIIVLDTAGVEATTLVIREATPSSLALGTGSSTPLDTIRYDSAGFARTSTGSFLAGCVRFDAAATSKSSGIVLDAAGRPRVWRGNTSDSVCV